MMEQDKYLTVAAITKYIEKKKFEVDPYMKQVFVRGEISNLKQPASGHLYFTVKDEFAMLRSVMFHKAVQKNWFCPRRWYECPYHRTNWRIYKSWSLSVLCRTYGTRWRRSALYSIRAIKIAIGKGRAFCGNA